jgi:branched-chain amino acid transport system substrate-binding protein
MIEFVRRIVVAFFAGSLCICWCAFAEKPRGVTNVGVILPLSGEVAAIGSAVKGGIEIAYDNLKPSVKEKIRLHFEDDGFQPKNSITALTRLMSDKQIDVLVNAGSSTGNALAPIAESKKLPFIAVATDSRVSRGRKYVFNLWVSPEAETDAVLAEMTKRGYKRVARIASVHDMNVAVKSAFDTKNNGKAEIVLDEEFPSDVKDFKPYLAKLKGRTDVSAVMALLFPGQIGVFAKQAREMGVQLPLFGYEFFEDPGEVAVSQGALVGQWYVNADDPDASFRQAFTSRYPGAATFGAANGHDAILLIAKNIENGDAPEKLPEFLHHLKGFNGALGRYSAAPDNRFTLPAAIKQVTATGFETASSHE